MQNKRKSSNNAIPKVQILLSTYNGEQFLRAQMESLLSQDYPHLEILVRDDGSSDGTPGILKEYEKLPPVRVIYGENLGFARSFLKLLRSSDPDAVFFAFSDQDDIWEPDKISAAVAILDEECPDQPGMYFSRVKLVDSDLFPIGISNAPKRPLSFGNALVQSVAKGCTILLNAEARDLCAHTPAYTQSHDWWCYLVVSAFGKIVFDDQSRILYRQHGRNVVGHSLSFWARALKRLRGGGMKRGACTAQAQELKRLFAELMPPARKDVLERFLTPKSFTGRLHYALSGDVYGQSLKDDMKLRFLIALNYH